MSRALTDHPQLGRLRRRPPAWLVAAVVGGLACLWLGLHLLAGPSFVRAVTVSNPTLYDVDVDVSDGGQHGHTRLGVVPRRSTMTIGDVADEGPVWVFVFSAQGRPGGQIRLSRHDLAAASWRLEIPAAVAGNLRAGGAIEPP